MLNDLSAFAEAVLSSRMDAAWSYDRNTGRYRDERGKFLSQASVQKLVDGRIDKLEASLKRFTRMLSNGSITLDQWQGSVREAIKAAHIQAAIIGHGDKAGMGSAEYGRVGQRLRLEYDFLANFASDLLGGRVSAPLSMARVSLYAKSVRSSYWLGTELQRQKQGYSLMRRVLDDQAQHCGDCLAFATRGIVPLGSVPLPGQRCACGARCKCRVEYFRQQFPVTMV
jgi:hypothetical protein